MGKIVTFGEIMMRLTPRGYKRIMQANSFDAAFGGGEANVTVSLAQFGDEAEFVTRLPDNELGARCLRELRSWGVDVSHVARGGERLGLYFCENGVSQRPGRVVYDRAGSSFAAINMDDIDIDATLEGADWFHWTGITPALSKGAETVLEALLKAAKERGITVSCDINYRKKLWDQRRAGEVMRRLCGYVDLMISNEEDCAEVFGIGTDCDVEGGKLDARRYGALCPELKRLFPQLNAVAFTMRESYSASVNGWSGLLFDGEKTAVSKKYEINIVDRVGGGDSFAAGLIHALHGGADSAAAVQFAVAAACLKHTIEGDFNVATEDEVKALAEGSGNGRYRR